MYRKYAGFTLLEILTVLLIISMLALFAYPNYMNYLYKSKRSDAMNSLFHYQAQWQQCMIHLHETNPCLAAIHLPLGQTQKSLQQHYEIGTTLEANQVIFSATPIHTQAGDEACARLTLNSQGVTFAMDRSGENTTALCWGT